MPGHVLMHRVCFSASWVWVGRGTSFGHWEVSKHEASRDSRVLVHQGSILEHLGTYCMVYLVDRESPPSQSPPLPLSGIQLTPEAESLAGWYLTTWAQLREEQWAGWAWSKWKPTKSWLLCDAMKCGSLIQLKLMTVSAPGEDHALSILMGLLSQVYDMLINRIRGCVWVPPNHAHVQWFTRSIHRTQESCSTHGYNLLQNKDTH